MRTRVIGIAVFFLVVLVAIGVRFAFNLGGQPGTTGGIRSVVQPKKIETLKGYVGGEKVGLLDDPQVQKILAEKYGLKLDYTRAGSFEMVDLANDSTDFLFPSSQSAIEYLRDKETVKAKKNQVVFSSPIVIYSWAEVADALVKRGIAKKVGDVYFITDMAAFVKLMEAGKTWADIGVPSLFGKVKVISTDPNKSNSGNQFAALLANVMAGDVVDAATVPKVIPRLKALYDRLGYLDSSSGDLFSQYLRLGAGAYPMAAGYENQIIEFAASDPAQWKAVKNRLAILYPEQTVWSQHEVITLTDRAAPLIAAMQDPEIQRLAWLKHGFRTGVAGSASATASETAAGVPSSVTKVVPMPKYDVLRQLMNALQ
jgi:hypothetical protein